MIQRELQDSELRAHSRTNLNKIQAEAISPKIYSSLRDNNEFVEGSSSMPMEVEYPSPDLDAQDSAITVAVSGVFTCSPFEMSLLLTSNIADSVVMFGPHLPHEYIKIIPHPHSLDPTAKIFALSVMNLGFQSKRQLHMPQPEPRPWAPFENIADFEYTETAIQGLLPKWIINKQLAGFNSNWADGSRLTIKNSTEMERVLSKARKYFVQVRR